LYAPAKLGEVYKIYLDAGKAHKYLGWKPTMSLQEGIQKTVEHFRTHLATT